MIHPFSGCCGCSPDCDGRAARGARPTTEREIDMADKCDATFITDTYETFTCERPDDVHLRHRDNNGTTAIRVPGGALISKKTRK